MSIYGKIATAAAGPVVSGIFGLANRDANDRRQLEQQEKLQKLQIKGGKEMSDYEKKQQLDMWNKTNYGAQVEHMKKAGINPALLYGQAGAGGATAGGGSGAMPSGGAAPAGGGEMEHAAGMGMQLALMGAQKAVLESQANKNNVEADKIGGVDTDATIAGTNKINTEIANLIANTANTEAKTSLTKVQTAVTELERQYKDATIDTDINKAIWTADTAKEKLQQAQNETYISNETRNEIVKQIENNGIGIILKNASIKQDIKLSEAKIGEITESLEQRWGEMVISREGIQASRDNMEELTNTMLISAGIRATGDIVNSILNIKGMKGKKSTTSTTTDKSRYDKKGNYTGGEETHTRTTTKH